MTASRPAPEARAAALDVAEDYRDSTGRIGTLARAYLALLPVSDSTPEPTCGTQGADAMSFEDLLACPNLQFDLRGELLPHLLRLAPQSAAAALTKRPWLFEPGTSTTAAFSAALAEPEPPTSTKEQT